MQIAELNAQVKVKFATKLKKEAPRKSLISRIVSDRQIENLVWSSYLGFYPYGETGPPLRWIGVDTVKYHLPEAFTLTGGDKHYFYASTKLGIFDLTRGQNEMTHFIPPTQYFPHPEIDGPLAAAVFELLCHHLDYRAWITLGYVCKSGRDLFFGNRSPFHPLGRILSTFVLRDPVTPAPCPDSPMQTCPWKTIHGLFSPLNLCSTVVNYEHSRLVKQLFPGGRPDVSAEYFLSYSRAQELSDRIARILKDVFKNFEEK